jgi:hypothetical protein
MKLETFWILLEPIINGQDLSINWVLNYNKDGENDLNFTHKKFKFINFMTVPYIRNVTLYLILM